jgi:hypothetical protein
VLCYGKGARVTLWSSDLAPELAEYAVQSSLAPERAASKLSPLSAKFQSVPET